MKQKDSTQKKSNAGAKKKTYEQKKHAVTVFIEGFKITKRGGLDAMKKHLYSQA